MGSIRRKCGLLALVVLLCLWALAGVGLGTPGGPVPPPDCPPCPDCTHCGGAAADWNCVTDCNICEFECPCKDACDDPDGPYGAGCLECTSEGCESACEYLTRCEDCDGVAPGGVCRDRCTYERDDCMKCDGEGGCISECDSDQNCCNGECTTDCWEVLDVAPNALSYDCPDCDNAEGGCFGSQVVITRDYSFYTDNQAGPGDVGFCVKKTKMQAVGYHVFCLDRGLDVTPIIDCLNAAMQGDCLTCLQTGLPFWCAICAASLYNLQNECIQEPCDYVESCETCQFWGSECAPPYYDEVVDWDNIPTGSACISQ